MEPGGDRGPRHRLRDADAEDARADRSDEGDLDRNQARISWRAGRIRRDDDLAEARAEAASAGYSRRRLSMGSAARSAMATAGTRTPRAAIPRNTYPPSARWPRVPGAIPPLCRSRSAARPTI